MFLSTFIVVHNHTNVYFMHCVLCTYTNTLENGGKRFKRSKLKEHGYLVAIDPQQTVLRLLVEKAVNKSVCYL